MEYLPAASCCVDKYSEKLKKLIVFSAFQSVYPLVRMTDSFFARFAFSFSLRYNSPSKTKTRSTEHDEDLLTGRTEQFQQGNTRAVILSMQDSWPN